MGPRPLVSDTLSLINGLCASNDTHTRAHMHTLGGRTHTHMVRETQTSTKQFPERQSLYSLPFKKNLNSPTAEK